MRWNSYSAGSAADHPGISPLRIAGARILVVDDVEMNRRILTEILRGSGFRRIETAADGLEALRKTHELRPDLVILDLVMPGMDGFEYTRCLRADDSFAGIPVLVQTTLSDPAVKMRIFQRGVTDYILKPVDPGELRARVKVHLSNKFMLEDLMDYQSRTHDDLMAACELQRKLLPDSGQIELQRLALGIGIAAFFQPSTELGGDCWGFRKLSSARLALYIFDFSGHGAASALNSFRLHTLLHQESAHAGEPGPFMEEINRRLARLLPAGNFATMFYGIIDVAEDSLRYASSGAPPPLLLRQEALSPTALDSRGFLLGAAADARYDTQTLSFLPGDALLLYSDTLIESPDTSGRFLTEPDLGKALCEGLRGGDAQKALEQVLDVFWRHAPPPLRDDLTLTLYQRVDKPPLPLAKWEKQP